MKQTSRILAVAASSLLVLASVPAQAIDIPKSADPSRTEKQIAPLTKPGQSGSVGAVTSTGVSQAPKGADKVKLTLATVTVKDMTVYDEAEVRALYANMVGKTISLSDVYDLAARLTAKYRNDGYILTQVVVPPQTIEGGHVRLRVVEGFTNDVRLEGETNGKLSDLQPYVDKIRAARPFSAKTLERYLLLINDLPGITARSVLSPSKVQGATDIAIVVSRKPHDLFAQVDNRGTRYIGPMQLNGGVRFNNAFGTYEGLSLQYATAPFHGEMNYGAISVTEPVGHEGTTVTLGGNLSRTLPGYLLRTFDVRGVSHNANLEVAHPFLRSRNENFFSALRFDYLDSHRTDNVTGFAVEDRLSVLRLGATYELVDRYAGANTVKTELSKGLSILGSTGGGRTTTTRPGADDRFVKGTAEISRLQRVTDYFDFFISAAGQLASGRLLTPEQFGLGGVTYGSAYDSSEIAGDDGVAGRTELRLNDPFRAPEVKSTQFYAFYDIGKVWDPGNAVVADQEADLASAGGGLRLSVDDNISGSLEIAAPLTRDVATQNGRPVRAFFALTAKF